MNVADWERGDETETVVDDEDCAMDNEPPQQTPRAKLKIPGKKRPETGKTSTREEDDLQHLLIAALEAPKGGDGDVPMTLAEDHQPQHRDGGHQHQNSPPRHRRVEELQRSSRRPGRTPSGSRKRKRPKTDEGRSRASRSRSRFATPGIAGCSDGQDAIPLPLEMPRRSDFDGSSPSKTLRVEYYQWGRPSPRIPLDHPMIPKYAPRPRDRVPNPMDDSADAEEFESFPRRSFSRNTPKKTPKSSPFISQDEDETLDQETDKNGQAKGASKDDEPDPPSLNDMPTEVRERIFRHLLVRKDPIHVYDGWTKVYRQTRQNRQSRQSQQTKSLAEQPVESLQPAILRVCKTFFQEGVPILYGQNRFLYRLRDAPIVTAPPPVDVSKLAIDDSTTNDQASETANDDVEHDSDPDYEEEPARFDVVARRSNRRGKRKDPSMDGAIHIAKYFSFFRFIIVEAERNRHEEDTMKGMADAINVFVKPPVLEQAMASTGPKTNVKGTDSGSKRSRKRQRNKTATTVGKQDDPSKANIHTLTIKVHPRHIDYDVKGRPTYSFTPFFAGASPVIEAMRALFPQFLRIEVITKHDQQERRKGARMCVDMRALRILRRVRDTGQDDWGCDRVMVMDRYRRAKICLNAVAGLEDVVLRYCRRDASNLEDDEVQGLAPWDDFEDIGEDFGEDVGGIEDDD